MAGMIGTWVALLLGLLAILGMLWRTVGRPIAGLVERLDSFWDDWTGRPGRPGRPAEPGVMERLARIEARQTATEQRTERIEHELRPNSGTSLRDAVDRVELAVTPDPPT